MKPKKTDIIYAVLGLVFLVVLSGFLNTCEGSELDLKYKSRWYTEMGFGYTNDENIFCRNDSLNLYGIIHFGYEVDDQMRVQYRHNSCVDKEHNEGSLDGVEIIWRFAGFK